MIISEEIITPKVAENYLAKNIKNRRIRKDRVQFYAKQMKDGQWIKNGETIKFDTKGNLIDGQHRLCAVISSDISLKMLVIRDILECAIPTIDTGAARCARDVLSISGIVNSSNIASGIAKYIKLKNSTYSRGSTSRNCISNSDILKEYESNPDLYQTLYSEGASFYNKNFRIITPGDFIGYYRYFMLRFQSETIDGFFDSITEKTGIGGLLYNKLLHESISKRKLTLTEKTALIIKAFIYHSKNKNISLLKFAKDEIYPSIL